MQQKKIENIGWEFKASRGMRTQEEDVGHKRCPKMVARFELNKFKY